MDLDFSEAEANGWKIEPRLEARKGDRVLIGTAAALHARITEHEEGEALAVKQRQHAVLQEHHTSISRFVRLLYTLGEEHKRALSIYLNKDKHHSTRMTALEEATRARTLQNETFDKLFSHSKETLLASDDFLELQGDDALAKLDVAGDLFSS